ncbi:MAG: DUF3732 domain-containing protein [Planctomycetota bacterium]
MNIREILIYSHSGQMRRISFKVRGLNIVTGRSSTGKSTLSDIVEYCMGRSTFNIPEGPIRDKVAWYAVIYQFPGEQILIAKPTPATNAASCSKAMIRRGATIEPPSFTELQQNADDETVISLLSELIGIPANRTQVPMDNSRSSFDTTIQHTYYYLFQKQGIIANREQLFYRQNEPYTPQTIIDTLPVLLGVVPDSRLELDLRLRTAKRELKIAHKQLSDAEQFSFNLNIRALGLISEARQVGILASGPDPETTDETLKVLSKLIHWKPVQIPDEDTCRIAELEDEIATIRKERKKVNETLRATQLFVDKEDGFTTEAGEQKSRLESINALPKQSTGEWQWPFAPKNLNLESPIATVLLRELESLNKELETVSGDRPRLKNFTLMLENQKLELNQLLINKEEGLAAAIAANAAIAEMGSQNASAARVVGRISLFLETYRPDDDLAMQKKRIVDLKALVTKLETETGTEDRAEQLASILNIISNRISRYVQELDAEFKEFPFRFDLSKLTIVADRPERPVPMNKTGGGANHLAYHLGAILAFHHYASNNKKPIPSFLFLDQPTQVYFPSEQIYKSASGKVEETERNSDIEKVRNLFAMLLHFVEVETPGFQIIVTEHANLRDEWFQKSIVETPWAKPPALVPDEWESSS